jgi:hypothetical protein
LCVRGWSVCVLYVVCDDSLVENGQQTSYGSCCVGAVGGDGAKKVCNAACARAISCCCASFSAHDALAAVYAAQFACAAVGSGSFDGVASRVRVPDREHNPLG